MATRGSRLDAHLAPVPSVLCSASASKEHARPGLVVSIGGRSGNQRLKLTDLYLSFAFVAQSLGSGFGEVDPLGSNFRVMAVLP